MRRLWRLVLPLLLCVVTLVTLLPAQKVHAAETETTMKTSDAYIKLLKGWEGFRATPYWDVSHYSIGYGTTCPDDKVDYYTKNPMSEATAEKWLQSSLAGFENSVNSYAKKHGLKLSQNQFDALVSFTYNCGASWTNELNGYFNTAVRYGDKGRLFMYGIGLYGSAGGDYILMRRRMREANIYLNGKYTNEYPDNYRWVFLNGGGGKPRYPVYAFDANKPEPIQLRFSELPVGKNEDGSTFVYELAGWYTADGKKVEKLDTTLTRGQILYARWKNSDGKVVKLPTGKPVKEQKLTITEDKANIRNGPGTYYDKTGELKKGATLTLKETYEVGSTTWGNTDKGWLSLGNTNYIPPKDTFPKAAKMNASGVNYRSGPGTNYKSYGKLSKGTKLTIIDANEKNTWGKFMKDGKECWVSLQYVDYEAETVTKLELLKVPDKVNYTNYKKPLELEGSMIRITYASGQQVVRTIATSDVKDDRTATSTSATVTATVGGKSVSFEVYFGKYTELKITKQPEDVYVQLGEVASTTVEVQGEGVTYQWYLKDPGNAAYSMSSIKSATYSYEMTEAKSGRKVYCIVTDKYGSTEKTDVVTMKQEEYAEILEQPADTYAKLDRETKVTLVARGDGNTYQWYYQDGDGEPQKSSATTAEYITTMTEDKNGRKLFCEVTDKYGNKVTSEPATLILAPDIVITKQPESVKIAPDAEFAVTVEATGDDLTYQWYYKEKGGSIFYLTTSFTGNTYSTTMTDSRAGRQIYCVVSDRYGDSVKSDVVTLNMHIVAKITKQPESVKVGLGENARVEVGAEGDGLTYQWYVKDMGAEEFKVSSVKTAEYYFAMTEEKSGRQVYCVVTDQYGNSQQSDTVTMEAVEPVKITEQPKSVEVENGEELTISVTAEGVGLNYQWYFKNVGDSKFQLTGTFKTETYSVTMSDARNGRQVYCVVTDKYGNKAQSEIVTMSMRATAATKVAITAQPVSVTVENGEEFVISFTAQGEGLNYQWYYKEKGGSTFYLTNTFKSNTYTTTMSDARNGRQVYCVVTDKYGNKAQTDTVTMTMEETEETKVTITKQPASVTVEKNKSFTISFTATGDGLQYAWYYKNKGESKFQLTTTFTGNTYSSVMTDARNGRQVYCVVTDQYGNKVQTNTVTMTMKSSGKVTITRQPSSAAAAKGKTVTVSFTASGEDLSYTWYYKDSGKKIFTKSGVGKGNTYSVEMTTARNGRQLYCVVKDKYGNKVQTNTVTIKISTLKITDQPDNVKVAKGKLASTKVVASGEGLTYQWYIKNPGTSGFAKSSVTEATYSYTMVAEKNGRQAYCVITDKYGNSVKTNTVTFKMK